MQKNTASLSGGLSINKEAGITSFDVIRSLRKRFGKLKLGHSGTLDPFATGVLLILVGNATRLQDELHLLPKTYKATIMLGARTDTDDSTGVFLPLLRPAKPLGEVGPEDQPTEAQVLSALAQIKAQTSQIPPAYAAIKVQGKKLYEYAREGREVEKKPRPITIHEIVIEEYEYPTLKISVTCSTGTYIRSIARDIGDILGTGAYCSKLTRTTIGPFTIQNTQNINELPDNLHQVIVPPEQLVAHIPSIEFSELNVAKLKNGREVESEKNTPLNTPIALLDVNKKLFGVGIRQTDSKNITPKKIFL